MTSTTVTSPRIGRGQRLGNQDLSGVKYSGPSGLVDSRVSQPSPSDWAEESRPFGPNPPLLQQVLRDGEVELLFLALLQYHHGDPLADRAIKHGTQIEQSFVRPAGLRRIRLTWHSSAPVGASSGRCCPG